MQVFSAYFKIIRKNMTQMLIFLGIFAALSVAFSSIGIGQISTGFVSSKPSIAIFSTDGDTVLVKGFKDYMGKVANVVSIENREDAVQDALFFRKVTYIIWIPANFTDGLMGNQTMEIDRRQVPDSYDAMLMDYVVDKYCRTARIYAAYAPAYTQEEIVKAVDSDLSKTATIAMHATAVKATNGNNSVYFFNYFAYSLFAILLLGVTSFMLTFQNPDLRRRNTASPMSLKKMNTQLIAGNVVFAFVVWLIMFGLAFLLFRESLMNISALYYGINTLIYTLVCVSISFFVGNLIRSRNAQAPIVNVLALGLSFISGVFVPQFMLGDTVLRIASFTPTFWFVKANTIINDMDMASPFSLSLISRESIMQLIFAVVFFALSFLVIRARRTGEA